MKILLTRLFKTNVVLISLLIAAIIVVMYSCFKQRPPDTPKPFVEYVTDQLHLVAMPDALQQEHATGKVVIDKTKLRAAFPVPRPLGSGNFTGMGFIVPGVAGLENYTSYFFQQSPPANRDRNIVRVVSIAPRSRAEYARNPPDRDEHSAWRRVLPDGFLDKHATTEYLGMKCVDGRDYKKCIVEIKPGSWAHISIGNDTLRRGSFWPSMRVMYYTDDYGGLDITWDVYIEHAAKWREIDAKLWRLIRDRNLLETP